MPSRILPSALLPLLLMVPLPWLADRAEAQGSVAGDKAALVALYDATAGAQWTTSTNWKGDEALSTWHGVTTDGDGRVTALALNDNGLDGTLPSALGDLSALETLELGGQRPARGAAVGTGRPERPRLPVARTKPGLERCTACRAGRPVEPDHREDSGHRAVRSGRQ